MSIKTRIAVALLVLAAITLTEFLVFMQGYLPQSSIQVEVKAPLYPEKTAYLSTIDVFLGRGLYEVRVNPATELQVCITAGGSRSEFNASRPVVVYVYSETGLHITILASIEPYQVDLGSITVVRRWVKIG
ncbi:MAG: hypothetical protein OWQ48_04050 [Desulfurococcus sp.]|nr:hypothetical protein [Desulfurococcus sp.]